MLSKCELIQQVRNLNGKLHPTRSIVASGVNTRELVVRNYRLGGQIEGKADFSDTIKQIEYTPCGHYLIVICGTQNLAVLRAIDFTLVGNCEIPAPTNPKLRQTDFLFFFEFNSQQQLKYMWLLCNEVDEQNKCVGYPLMSFSFSKSQIEGKFLIETKFNKYMKSSNDRALTFLIRKQSLGYLDIQQTLE
jgi:hypothetical protein